MKTSTPRTGNICNKNSKGFIASYILYGIALLAIFGAAYGKIQSTREESSVVENTVNEIRSQVEIIRSKIFICNAIYPNGDHGEFNARHSYPAPSAATSHRAALTAVECPGSTQTPKTLDNLGDGQIIPRPPKDFQPWVYEHTLADGISLRLTPTTSNGVPATRTRLKRQFDSLATEDGDTLVIKILN